MRDFGFMDILVSTFLSILSVTLGLLAHLWMALCTSTPCFLYNNARLLALKWPRNGDLMNIAVDSWLV